MRFILIILGMGLLTGCTNRSYTPTVPEALEVGTPYTVFAASSRAKDSKGTFGHERSSQTSLLELTVSIPPSHKPGELDFAYANPKPDTQFTMAERKQFSSPAEFQSRLREKIRENGSNAREVTVFVHGYNATQAETAFRAAQLAHDIDLPGALVIYSWPSRGKPFGYAYDSDSMLFARDGLEQLLNHLRGSGVENIILVAHSMGSALSLETLRQAEIREPGWAEKTLAGVVLISPDLDVDVFRTQMSRFETVPQPFILMVSEKDKALNLSSRLRGTTERKRLGNSSDLSQLSDLPIEVIDTTEFSSDAYSSHFVAATSPALLAIFDDLRRMGRTFGPNGVLNEQMLPGVTIRKDQATRTTISAPNEPSH
ncbi:alpha/beta hydrolase [Primorskyibacter sp. S87]|uniref:alpha/beta hydrolase n=1 Tax=Primorskyibacter sp. S87 TaxID=3415126 RepID=UPI003C7995A6